MTKRVVLVALAAITVLLCPYAAFAQTADSAICILGIICIGGGGHHAAPAPLLGSGIPEFTALGLGVLVTFFYTKLRRR